MSLTELVERSADARRWDAVTKLPWDDPAFSERMLREHLSQAHNAASRRFEVIDRHAEWIHGSLLGGRASRVLDVGCGPGLYAQRLAALGHACAGIDFAPAAIGYARRAAEKLPKAPRYTLGDAREVDFGGPFDLVMMISGELNVFSREDAAAILRKAAAALARDGRVLLEVHHLDAVRTMGLQPRRWMAVSSGLFSNRPHLRLDESRWDDGTQRATTLHWVVDAQTGALASFGTRTQAYSDAGYDELLGSAGLARRETLGALPGSPPPSDMIAIVAAARRADGT